MSMTTEEPEHASKIQQIRNNIHESENKRPVAVSLNRTELGQQIFSGSLEKLIKFKNWR